MHVGDDVKDGVFAVIGTVGALGIATAVLNAAKEKFWTVAVSILIPLVGIVGLFRLAKPGSLWAHHLYGEKKLARAVARFGEPDPESNPPSSAAAEGSSG